MKDIQSYSEDISSMLMEGFEKELFESIIKDLDELKGPLRINNFASNARELISLVLRRLAPDYNVIRCKWYKDEINGKKDAPTRSQKISYAIYGGLSKEFAEKQLGVNVDYRIRCINDQYNILSKYTHVNEGTFGLKDKENVIALESLSSLNSFLKCIKESHEELADQLSIELRSYFYDEISNDYFDAFSHLAWHTCIEDVWIDDLIIDEISYDRIYYSVSGSVSVELLCGREPGEKEEDTHIGNVSCPFSANASCSVSDFLDIELGDIDIETPY